MNKSILPVLVLLLFNLSCKENTTTEAKESAPMRTAVTIKLTKILVDSVSVRALEYKDNYYYAGSKGNYGSFAEDGSSNESSSIEIDSVLLEFRSIVVTDNYTYILNAGAPAYIYRVDHKSGDVKKVYEEQTEGVFYDSLKFWNEEEGIAFGDPTAQGDAKCITILQTMDAGESWQKVPCDKLPEFIDGEAGFAASNSNISIQGDHVWIATGGKASRVIHSADRGNTWNVQQTPIVSGGEMTGIFAMDFYDENTGVIIGGDWSQKENSSNNKAITKDGGSTWKLMADGSGPGYSSDIAFVPGTDGQEIIAVGTPGIWWSGDQGSTWKQLSDEGYYTVAMKDRNNGMLMGYAKAARIELTQL